MAGGNIPPDIEIMALDDETEDDIPASPLLDNDLDVSEGDTFIMNIGCEVTCI